jgi:succinate dehydrogenase iron-sulfur subunit
MSAFTVLVRRYDPQRSPDPWDERHTVELDATRSVLDALVDIKDRDGTLAVRYSCRAAICGSCAVRVNGRPGLACRTPLGTAAEAGRDGVIAVEPIGNMPVIKDLVVDMDAGHWEKIGRARPWLAEHDAAPEREHIVPHDVMVDVTQTMACIQCGACVSDCLSLEVDPLFIGPAALAKAQRLVSDPRDAAHAERLRALADDPHGMYDCTHCFMCVDACPKDVAPMSQIMRLRRAAGSDHGIVDPNNGYRHEHAFVENIRRNGLLQETDLVIGSYGGRRRALAATRDSMGVFLRALLVRRKFGVRAAVGHPHRAAFRGLDRIFDRIAARPRRVELNLYVSGSEEEPGATGVAPVVEEAGA